MQTRIKHLFTEPLVQFLILGGLLFLLVSYVQRQQDEQSLEIVVDNERIGMMILNYQTQTGALPSKQQLDALIDQYIQDEILYREARKMGLDRDDEIIRRRLIQKIDFLQSDLAEIKTPSVHDLQTFYQNNPALFRQEATVNFSHIYFSTDNSTDSLAKQRAVTVLQQLQGNGVQRAPEKGDRFPLQYDYTEQSTLDVQQNFGNKPMLQKLFQAPIHNWVGPVQSGYGWHLVYVTQRDSTTEMPFNSVGAEVKIKYIEAEKANQNKKRLEQLSEKYRINRAYLNTQ